jgi:trigger factor
MIDVDDRPVQDGDRVKLDFDGSVDGVPFDGGKGENYDLTIGSGSFIPGFEEQIVGKNIGEEFDVNVTFPENYQSKDLQGKAAVFKCRVNSIQVKELPELNDDFAQDVSEFDTLDEYRASVEAKIRERKEKDAQNQKETAAVEKAVANAAVEIPDAMVEDQAQRMVDEFAQQLQSQGLTIDQYRQYTGMNESAFLDQMKPQAIARIRSSLVLEAIAKAEQIEISDERLDEEIQKMADQYRMEKEKFYELLSDESKAQMKEDIAVQEAVKLIGGSAVEVDMPEEETEPADLEETPDAE